MVEEEEEAEGGRKEATREVVKGDSASEKESSREGDSEKEEEVAAEEEEVEDRRQEIGNIQIALEVLIINIDSVFAPVGSAAASGGLAAAIWLIDITILRRGG